MDHDYTYFGHLLPCQPLSPFNLVLHLAQTGYPISADLLHISLIVTSLHADLFTHLSFVHRYLSVTTYHDPLTPALSSRMNPRVFLLIAECIASQPQATASRILHVRPILPDTNQIQDSTLHHLVDPLRSQHHRPRRLDHPRSLSCVPLQYTSHMDLAVRIHVGGHLRLIRETRSRSAQLLYS